MTQSGQGEEPSPREAREGIVLPSDGGEPLLPGMTGGYGGNNGNGGNSAGASNAGSASNGYGGAQPGYGYPPPSQTPGQGQSQGPGHAPGPAGGQAWGTPWGPDQHQAPAPPPGQGWQSPPDQSWNTPEQSWRHPVRQPPAGGTADVRRRRVRLRRAAAGPVRPARPRRLRFRERRLRRRPGRFPAARGHLWLARPRGTAAARAGGLPAACRPVRRRVPRPPGAGAGHPEPHPQPRPERRSSARRARGWSRRSVAARRRGGHSVPPAGRGGRGRAVPECHARPGRRRRGDPVHPAGGARGVAARGARRGARESTQFLGRAPRGDRRPERARSPRPGRCRPRPAPMPRPRSTYRPCPGRRAGTGSRPPSSTTSSAAGRARSRPGPPSRCRATSSPPAGAQPLVRTVRAAAVHRSGPAPGVRRRGRRPWPRRPFRGRGCRSSPPSASASSSSASARARCSPVAVPTTRATRTRPSPRRPPRPTASASPSADPAEEQAVALDKLLADSGNSRTSVISAVANVKSCNNLGQAAKDLRDAAQQRTDLVTRLSGLTVDKLPDTRRADRRPHQGVEGVRVGRQPLRGVGRPGGRQEGLQEGPGPRHRPDPGRQPGERHRQHREGQGGAAVERDREEVRPDRAPADPAVTRA